jgi:uncharacterized membrane protein
MRFQLFRIMSLFVAGLIAGTFFYGSFTVLPTFYDVSPQIHLGFRTALMNYNKVIVMALVLLAIIVMAIYAWQTRGIRITRTLCLSALILTVLSLLITRLASVPINLQIKTWDPSSPPSDWLIILKRWNLYNAIRTGTSIASFGCLLLADLWLIRRDTP